MSTLARPDNKAAWLPAGKTCADCRHLERCVAMFAGFPEATACDWSPSRFSPKAETKPTAPPPAMMEVHHD